MSHKLISRQRQFRRLLAEQLEDRRVLASVTWDGGGGDMLWSNPLNWSGDALPGASDDVSIVTTSEITVVHDIGDTVIGSLFLRENLQVRGNSTITTGDLGVLRGKSVQIEGVNSQLVATGTPSIGGANLFAEAGGRIEIEALDSFVGIGDVYWRASGSGSSIVLPHLTTINNGTARSQDIRIEALQGGTIDLSMVTEIIDPDAGSQAGRAILVKSEGFNSLVDLSSLRNFDDYNSGTVDERSLDDFPQYSQLNASQGAEIRLGQVTSLRGVYIPLDGTGTVDTTTIENLRDSRIDVSNQAVQFPSLTQAYNTGFNISGIDVDFPILQSAELGWFTIDSVDIDLSSVTNIDGGDFYISGGVQIDLPSIASFTNTGGDVDWRTTGSGSSLVLPNLSSINNGTERSQDIRIEALQGGSIDLSAVTEIVDPDGGSQAGRAILVKSEGVNSSVDLSSLQNFDDYNFGTVDERSLDDFPQFSQLNASQGAEILLGQLTSLRGVYIPLDGTGTVDTTTIQHMRDSLIDVSNQAIQLSSLAQANNTVFEISGVNVEFPVLQSAELGSFTIEGVDIDLSTLTNVNGSDFHVSGGAALVLPGIASFTNTGGDVDWQVTGSGSSLVLPNLTTISNGPVASQDIRMAALQGGLIDLSSVTEIVDPNSGGQQGRAILMKSEGVNSLVDLGSLQNFADSNSGTLSENLLDTTRQYSQLTASQGAEIRLGQLISVQGVYIPLDGTGTVDITTIENLRDSRIDVSNQAIQFPSLTQAYNTGFNIVGVNVDFPVLQSAELGWFTIEGVDIDLSTLANINGGDFYISGGVQIELPNIANFTNTGGDVDWQATGSGSSLVLPNLTTIRNGSVSSQDIRIEAQQGGFIDLSAVTEIVDPNAGGQQGRAILVKSEGVNSLVDLSSLQNFADSDSGAVSENLLDNSRQYSQLTASQEAEIRLGQLTSVRGVYIPLDGTGTVDTTTIENLRDSRIDVSNQAVQFSSLTRAFNTGFNISGVNVDFPVLQSAERGWFTIDGVDIDLRTVTNINGSDFEISGGTQIDLPGIANFTNTDGDVDWRVTGSGSSLAFSNLTNIKNGTAISQDIRIEAQEGGLVDLSGVTEIVDPKAGDQRGRAILVKSEGVNSLVDLSSLHNFVDHSSGFVNETLSDGNAQYSQLKASQGAEIRLGQLTSLRGVYIPLDSESSLLAGELVVSQNSLLTGSGTILGSLTNRSQLVVGVGGVEVLGDFVQHASGTSQFTVAGAPDSLSYSHLAVGGSASLNGTLRLDRPNNFVPDVWSDFDLVSSETVVGRYSIVEGTSVGNPDIEVIYGSSSVVAARNFVREPFQSLTHENLTEGSRVFFDVLDTQQARVGYRLYAPNGEFVFASNSTVDDPDLGDFGAILLSEVGSYEVRMYKHPQDEPVSTYDIVPAPIDFGQLRLNQTTTGEIQSAGSLDIWQFNLPMPAEVNFSVLSSVGDGELRFTIKDASGRTVFTTSEMPGDGPRQMHQMKLGITGSYTVEVQGIGDSIGNYQFVLTGPESPRIISQALKGPSESENNEAWLYFNQEMDTGSFDLIADLLQLGNSTGEINATGFRWENSSTLVIEFENQPALEPIIVALSPDIFSQSGVPLDQDGDGNPGEPVEDQYATTIAVDTVGPRVFLTEPHSIASAPIDEITFYFSEPIDVDTFTQSDIRSFTGPGGNLINKIIGLVVESEQATVLFGSQLQSGEYTITVGPEVADTAGNLLDQNQDGNFGQADDAFTATILVTSPDLVVTNVANPVDAIYGDELNLSWTVKNEGSDSAEGLWWDYVYLSKDEVWDLGDTLVAKVPYNSNERGVVTGVGTSNDEYTRTVTAPMPGILPGQYRTLVRSNILSTIAETDFGDNIGSSAGTAFFDLPILESETPSSSSVNYRDALYFKIQVPESASGGSMIIRFDTDDPNVANELYVSRGAVPTRADYGTRSTQGLASNQWLLEPDLTAGAYYVLALAAPDQGQSGALGTATTQVELLSPGEIRVFDTHFGQGGRAGKRTIEINGANFDRSVEVSLSMDGEQVAQAVSYYRPSSEILYATFDLTTVATGNYDVTLQSNAGLQETVANSFEVVVASNPRFEPVTNAPPAFRRVNHAPYVHFPVTITWENAGLNDIEAPLFTFTSTEPFARTSDEFESNISDTRGQFNGHYSATLLAEGNSGPRGILMPGQSGSHVYQVVPRVSWTSPFPSFEDVIYVINPILDSAEDFDWDAVKEMLSAAVTVSDSNFEQLFGDFRIAVGPSEAQVAREIRKQLNLFEVTQDVNQIVHDGLTIAFQAYVAKRQGVIVEVPLAALSPGNYVDLVETESQRSFRGIQVETGRFGFIGLEPGEYRVDLGGGIQSLTPGQIVDVAAGVPQVVSTPATRSFAISGKVTSDFVATVSNATLVLLDGNTAIATTRSGSAGEYSFPDVAPGIYSVFLSHPGFVSSTDAITVANESVARDFLLSKGSSFTGTLQDSTGANLSDALFVAIHEEGEQKSARSDAAGRFRLDGLKDGLWDFIVSHPINGQLRHGPISFEAGESKAAQLQFGAVQALHGTVSDSDGTPIANATVETVGVETVLSVETDENGRFTLNGIPETLSEVALLTFAEGYGSVLTTASLETDASIVLSNGASIAGRVVDENGSPIPGASLHIRKADYPSEFAETGDDGLFEFQDLVSGIYRIHLEAPGFISRVVPINVDGQTNLNDLPLRDDRVISGQAFDTNGQLLTEGSVAVYRTADQSLRGLGSLDATGNFVLEGLDADNYTVQFSHSDLMFASQNVRTDAPDAPTLEFRTFSNNVTGVVRNTDGLPIGNVDLQLIWDDPSTGLPHTTAAVSSPSGSFTFHSVPNEELQLRVIADGFATQQIDVQDNQSVEVTLSQGVSLSGRVVNVEGSGLSAEIVLIDTEGVLFSTTSADDGIWQIENVPIGDFEILALAENHAIYRQTVTVVDNTSGLQLVLPASGANVSGRVLDRDTDVILPGAYVEFWYRDVVVATASTDGQGSFDIPGVFPAQFDAYVSLDGTFSTFRVTPGTESNLKLELIPVSFSLTQSQNAGGEGEGLGTKPAKDVVDQAEENAAWARRLRNKRLELSERYETVWDILGRRPDPFPSLPPKPTDSCGCIEAWRKLEEDLKKLEDDLSTLEAERTSVFRVAALALAYHEADAIAKQALFNAFHRNKIFFPLLVAVGRIPHPKAWLAAAVGGAVATYILDTEYYLSAAEFQLNRAETKVRSLEQAARRWSAGVDFINRKIADLEDAIINFRLKNFSPPDIQAPNASFSVKKGERPEDGSEDIFGEDLRKKLEELKENKLNWKIVQLNSPQDLILNGNGTVTWHANYCGEFILRYQLIVYCEGGEEKAITSGTITLAVTGAPPPPEPPPLCGGRWELVPFEDCFVWKPFYTQDCGSSDPNDIVGPWGVGDQRFVPATNSMQYTVRFENDAEKANAPAAVVRIEQTLDQDLDFSTFRLGTIGFGDHVISDGAGASSFSTRLDFTSEFGVLLDINAGIDVATGKARWEIRSIDPQTGEVPFNPLLGFLPPNIDGSEGQGFVTYSVQPKANLATGTVIDAVADIIFDQNEAIETPAIFNTIDADAPSSSVQPQPATGFPGHLISWSGDDGIGSGIDAYDVYVAQDGGPFELWLEETTATETRLLNAEIGSEYSFYSVAYDRVGNREQIPGVADTSITIVEPPTTTISSTTVDIPGGNPSVTVQFADDVNLSEHLSNGTIGDAIGVLNYEDGFLDLAGWQMSYENATREFTMTSPGPLELGLFEVQLFGEQVTTTEPAFLRGGNSGLEFEVPAYNVVNFVQHSGEDIQSISSSAPIIADWNNDGLMDLIIGEANAEGLGQIRVFLNSGSNVTPSYQDPILAQTSVGDLSIETAGDYGIVPRLYDWNGDDELDLVLGRDDGRLQIWRNINTSENPIFGFSEFAQVGQSDDRSDLIVPRKSSPDFVDWNKDGRTDMVVGSSDGRVAVYLNSATSGSYFDVPIIVQNGSGDLRVPTTDSSITIVDVTGDGRIDIVSGNDEGQLLVYPNTGSNAAPTFDGFYALESDGAPINLAGFAGSRPYIVDANADGTGDLVVGSNDGKIRIYNGLSSGSMTIDTPEIAGGIHRHVFEIGETTQNPGIAVTPTSGLTTSEDGGVATFSVVLNSVPSADVTIPLSSSDTTEGTISVESLLFTPTNALIPQVVTVTGVSDEEVDGDIEYKITTSAALSSDANYSNVDADDVSLTNLDKMPPAGITVAPTSGLTTSEDGGTDTFTVVLDSVPSGEVTIGISSSDPGEGTLSIATLVFTPSNALTPQVVTVTGINDGEVDGDIEYQIITAAAISPDPKYDGLDPSDVNVTNLAKTHPWHNNAIPTDVNDDGATSPIDALLIINQLNNESGLPGSGNQPPYMDTNADDNLSPIDALIVINALNNSSGEGEASSLAHQAIDLAFLFEEDDDEQEQLLDLLGDGRFI